MRSFILLAVLTFCQLSWADNKTDRSVPIVGATSPAGGTGHYKIVLTDENPTYNLYSPGFPDVDYPPNSQVYYDVEVNLASQVEQQAARILILFEMFAVEVSDFCAKDALEIYEPNYQTRVYCASQSGRRILTEGSSVRLRFFSDGSEQERGFSIRVELYRSSCTQNFVGLTQGSFSSPKFPKDYANYEICVWRIEAPPGKRVRVGFNELFNIQGFYPLCVNDALTVSLTGNLSQDAESFCGTQAPGEQISTGNVMILKFTSDCCEQNRGFSASFSIIDGAPPPTQEPELPTNCACGRENPGEERIVGGNDVTPPHRFPWQLALVNNKEEVKCGAALITKRYALTAAHCAVSPLLAPDTSKVLLGAFDLQDATKDYVGIEKYIVHPNFNKKTYSNDVALVKLANDVQFGHDVSPLCLPNPSFDAKDRQAVVSGWGALDESRTEYATTLKFVELDTVPLPMCKEKYGTVITDGHLCAGGDKKDACQGDSGGPLFTLVDNRWICIGVVSAGIGCGRLGYPGLFMDVARYVDWIEMNTQDSPACEAIKPQGPLLPNIENCGLPSRHVESRIVGGTPSRSDYPWMAFITVSYTSNNGVKTTYNGVGALISPKFVLTAFNWMQSWFPDFPKLFDVQLGRYDLRKDESNMARSYKVAAVYRNPNYQATAQYDNDMALLELTTDVIDTFRPVCLPTSLGYKVGDDAVAIGWGRTDTGSYNFILQEIDVQVADQGKCEQAYTRQTTVTNTMMCAGADRQGMCQGDAGSPLMILEKGRYYLVGLASFGSRSGCAVKDVPDVYSSVQSALDWIATQTGLTVN